MKKLTFTTLLILISITGNSQDFEPAKMQAFVDGFVTAKLQDKNIAGGVVSIIKDGQVLVSNGYGYSNLKTRTEVKPNETLFRIGSVSKLFVWLAVMQQVEKGKLDLDKDINHYLVHFKIPNTFEQPITLRHIMSHTAGFEDRLIKLFSINESDLMPLKDLLINDIPERIRPAGLEASYSNHATAIAAHIVELVSGLDWNSYVEKNIINPLGMTSTTFRQPLPVQLLPNMSMGYSFAGGKMVEKPFEYVPLAPAGSVSTSAHDMLLFMQMLINKGHLGDSSIINESTFQEMLQPVIIHSPGVNPCIHGFMDLSRKGVHIFGHGGDTFWFHSVLAIVPDQKMGIFASFNSEGGAEAYMEFLDTFTETFVSHNDTLLPAINLEPDYLKKFAGDYKMNRHPHSDYLKLISLLSRVKITADDGKLLVAQGKKIDIMVPTDKLTFRKENDSEFIKFALNNDGDVSKAYLSTLSVFAFEKVGFFESQALHFFIFGLAILLSLIVITYWPSVYLIRKRYIPMAGAPKPIPISAKIPAWAASFLLIFFYLGVAMSTSGPESVVYSVPTAIKYLLVVPILLIPINLFLLFKMLTVWPLLSTRLRSKIFFTLVCFAHIAAIWQLYYWNLIGWNY